MKSYGMDHQEDSPLTAKVDYHKIMTEHYVAIVFGGDKLQPTYIILIFIFIMLLVRHNQETLWLKRHIQSKRTEDKTQMVELAKRFIGKECIVSTFNTQLTGIIKEVSDGAILLESNNNPEL